jgi:hypothetical protein
MLCGGRTSGGAPNIYRNLTTTQCKELKKEQRTVEAWKTRE